MRSVPVDLCVKASTHSAKATEQKLAVGDNTATAFLRAHA